MSIQFETRKEVIFGVPKALDILRNDKESIKLIRKTLLKYDLVDESKEELKENKDLVIDNFIHMALINHSKFASCDGSVFKKIIYVMNNILHEIKYKYEQVVDWFCNQEILHYFIRTDRAIEGFNFQYDSLYTAYKDTNIHENYQHLADKVNNPSKVSLIKQALQQLL